MDDYKLENLVNLIDKLRPLIDEGGGWTVTYLRLQALFVYFQYAVASVRLQEENIQKMADGQHKNFSTHAEYADCLLKLYSSAVTAYSNLRTCLRFSKTIIDSISELDQDGEFKNFRIKYEQWVKGVTNKRDRITAHPEEKDRIVWKPNMWSDNGQVRFRAINPQIPSASQEIILEPRKDLEKLREYLSRLSIHLARTWKLKPCEI
ncbi:MAG: hypothetical protein AB1721_02610 [Patescibacteria group bacterium]